jgi:hypothetical protein
LAINFYEHKNGVKKLEIWETKSRSVYLTDPWLAFGSMIDKLLLSFDFSGTLGTTKVLEVKN